MTKRQIIPFIAALLIACLVALGAARLPYLTAKTQPDEILVSAAASLKPVMEEIKPLYQRQATTNLNFNFGASGALLQQIQQGAPVDVFISAATKQIDTLEQQGKLVLETRRNFATNRLVLIAPRGATAVTGFSDLARPTVKRIAIGEPRSVPAGQYAQEVLQKLNFYTQVRSKLVLANNVRQVLAAVESGDADAGFVYITDAQTSNNVRTVAVANAADHSPIVYPIAVLNRSQQAAAANRFVQFLFSPQAKSVLQKYGFGTP